MRRHLLKMGKSVFLLLVVVVVVSQAQSQSLSARPGRQQGQSRRPNVPRLQQGSIVRAASSGARKPSGAKLNVKPNVIPNVITNVKPNAKPNAKPSAKLSIRQAVKAQPRRPKLTAGTVQLSASSGSFGFPQAKCKGRCNFPAEVCVKKARCGGQSCFFCADTKSLPKIVEKKPKPSPTPPATNFGFGGMGMNNMGMFGMQQQQQQPTDFFSDIFGLGPSNAGGFDMFGTRQPQMGNQRASSGFPNSLFSGNSQSSSGPSINSASLLPGSSQTPSSTTPTSPMLPTYNYMRETPTMDIAPGLASLFGGLFGGGSGGMGGGSGGLFGGGSGGMGGGGGMNLLSMSMLGMDPFQLF